MKTEVVRCEINDHIALVTIDNPPVNAQDQRFHDDMMLIFDTISDLDEVRVAVLTGAGKVFSAGANIKNKVGEERGPGDAWRHSRRARGCFNSILDCRKPVIAAVDGYAIGSGNILAYTCDFTVATTRSRFGQTGPRVGSPANGHNVAMLAARVGQKRAREIWMLLESFGQARPIAAS